MKCNRPTDTTERGRGTNNENLRHYQFDIYFYEALAAVIAVDSVSFDATDSLKPDRPFDVSLVPWQRSAVRPEVKAEILSF